MMAMSCSAWVSSQSWLCFSRALVAESGRGRTGFAAKARRKIVLAAAEGYRTAIPSHWHRTLRSGHA
jgi:hypothetical protein